MPTEARGNYLPEAPYLRETKTYLNYMHASESALDSDTSGTASHSSRHDMLAIISSRSQYGPFLFFVGVGRGGRKGIRPVKTEWWGTGVVISLE